MGRPRVVKEEPNYRAQWFDGDLSEFTPIKGVESLYGVSRDGRIISYPKLLKLPAPAGATYLTRPRLLKLCVNQAGRGYHVVYVKELGRKTTLVHRIVAETFLENPDNKPNINHKDGNSRNNHIDNLEWCTHKENMHHCTYEIGTHPHPPIPIIGWKPTGEGVFFHSIALAEHFGFKYKSVKKCAMGQRTIKPLYKGYKWEFFHESV